MSLGLALLFLFAAFIFLFGLFIYLPYVVIRKIINRNYKPIITIKRLLVGLLITIVGIIALSIWHDKNKKTTDQFNWQQRDLPKISLDFPYPIEEDKAFAAKMSQETPGFAEYKTYRNKEHKKDLVILITEISNPTSDLNQDDLSALMSQEEPQYQTKKDVELSGHKCFYTSSEKETQFMDYYLCKLTDKETLSITLSHKKELPSSYVERIISSITLKP